MKFSLTRVQFEKIIFHSLAVVTFVLQHIPKAFQSHGDESPSADRESEIGNPDQSRLLT